MGTRTIPAIYQDGVFKPLEAVPLAENEQVILVVQEPTPMSSSGSLFGAFPALGTVEPDNIAWAEDALARGVQRQLRVLMGEED